MNTKNPKISIITVCYNSEETIEDTIKSVISQTYQDIEFIIVDGASNDSTLDIVSKYKSGVDKIISEPDNGIYDAMNKGVNASTGDIVGILNSDDLYADENVIKDIVEKFISWDCESVYADLVYVDRIDLNKVTRYWKSGEYNRNSFKYGWMPPHPTFFTLKRCYENYGKYDLKLKSAADYELMLRMLYKNEISAAYLPRVIIKMRVGGQSNESISNRLKANAEDKEAWAMNNIKPSWYSLKLKPIRKLKQFFQKPPKS